MGYGTRINKVISIPCVLFRDGEIHKYRHLSSNNTSNSENQIKLLYWLKKIKVISECLVHLRPSSAVLELLESGLLPLHFRNWWCTWHRRDHPMRLCYVWALVDYIYVWFIIRVFCLSTDDIPVNVGFGLKCFCNLSDKKIKIIRFKL